MLPEDTTFGVRISGDSMEPEFHDGQIAWVLQQESSLSRLMKSNDCVCRIKQISPQLSGLKI